MKIFDPGHYRLVPVEQDNVRHGFHALIQRDLTVFRFSDLEPKLFEDLAGNHSDDFGIVHNEACFHVLCPAY